MDLKDELDHLNDHAYALEESVRDIDDQIERAMHAVAAGTEDVGHAMMVVTERRNTQLGLMFELGKVTARIEDLENRIREQDERGRENRAVDEWQDGTPLAQEDHLDWLRPVLEAPVTEPSREEHHPHYEGEDRMLEEVHREDKEPEDYLDWWDKRG